MSNRLEALKARIARLRMSRDQLIAATGLDGSTLSRALNGHTNPLTTTTDKIEDAVAAEETALAKHLAKRGEAAA